jgi:ATP-dependent Clp protease ATP-binding subunit ClpA
MTSLINRIMKYIPSLDIYTDKMAESGRRVIRKAYNEARARDHDQLLPEHILVAIAAIERPLFNQAMRSLNVEPQKVVEAVIEAIEMKLGLSGHIERGLKLGDQLRPLLSNSIKHAHERGRRLIEATDIFVGLFKDEQSSVVEILSQLGVDQKVMRREMDKLINEG